METILETERLILRPLAATDVHGLFLLDSDPEVHRYIGQRPIKTEEEAANVIAIIRQQYQDYGIGRWAVIEKATNDFIGWCGFKYMTEPVNKHVNHYDFGYRLRSNFWNKGFATEASAAWLRHATDVLHLKEIYAMTDIDNMASRRVLEKTGFRLAEIFPYDALPNWREPNAPTTWYEYK